MSQNVIDFSQASAKHKHQREHEDKEAKYAEMKERFEAALPNKKTPVKDYFKKKRAKKAKH